MLRRYQLAAAIVVLAVGWAQPASAQVIVMSESLDCGLWIKARSQKSSVVLEGYVQGLLNGLAFGAKIDFWKAGGILVSPEQVYLWMDKYCLNEPLSDTFQGAVVLFNERTGNALQRHWTALESRPK
jgi:hypothetical protein